MVFNEQEIPLIKVFETYILQKLKLSLRWSLIKEMTPRQLETLKVIKRGQEEEESDESKSYQLVRDRAKELPSQYRDMVMQIS